MRLAACLEPRKISLHLTTLGHQGCDLLPYVGAHGSVYRLVAQTDLVTCAFEVARTIAAKPPEVVRRLKLSESVVFSNVERYGNTSAASIPVALCEAVEGGLVQAGATLVLSGFGAGLSWGSAVWKWQG